MDLPVTSWKMSRCFHYNRTAWSLTGLLVLARNVGANEWARVLKCNLVTREQDQFQDVSARPIKFNRDWATVK